MPTGGYDEFADPSFSSSGGGGGGSSGLSGSQWSEATNWSVSESTPTFQSSYLRGLFNLTGNAMGQPLEFYRGDTIAGFGPETEAALRALYERGAGGSSLESATQDQLEATQRGEFLGANPYLDRVYDAASRAMTRGYHTGVLPALEARFGGAGRTNSAAYMGAMRRSNDVFGTNLGEMGANLYGNAYERERDRMTGSGARNAMDAAAMDYRNIEAMREAGGERDALSQARIDELVNRHNFTQMEPWMRAEMASNIFQAGNWGMRTVNRGGESVESGQGFGVDDGVKIAGLALSALTVLGV